MRGSAGRARIAARAAQIEGVFIAFPKRNVYKYRVLYTSRAYAHQYRNRRRLTRRGYGRGRSLDKEGHGRGGPPDIGSPTPAPGRDCGHDRPRLARRSRRTAGGPLKRTSAMIVVDSSVWIANLRDLDTNAVRALRSIEDLDDILVGDLILLEGAARRAERGARRAARDRSAPVPDRENARRRARGPRRPALSDPARQGRDDPQDH